MAYPCRREYMSHWDKEVKVSTNGRQEPAGGIADDALAFAGTSPQTAHCPAMGLFESATWGIAAEPVSSSGYW